MLSGCLKMVTQSVWCSHHNYMCITSIGFYCRIENLDKLLTAYIRPLLCCFPKQNPQKQHCSQHTEHGGNRNFKWVHNHSPNDIA